MIITKDGKLYNVPKDDCTGCSKVSNAIDPNDNTKLTPICTLFGDTLKVTRSKNNPREATFNKCQECINHSVQSEYVATIGNGPRETYEDDT